LSPRRSFPFRPAAFLGRFDHLDRNVLEQLEYRRRLVDERGAYGRRYRYIQRFKHL
jgi:hypothetical protein